MNARLMNLQPNYMPIARFIWSAKVSNVVIITYALLTSALCMLSKRAEFAEFSTPDEGGR